MNGQMDGWMDGWIDGRMDGAQMDNENTISKQTYHKENEDKKVLFPSEEFLVPFQKVHQQMPKEENETRLVLVTNK